MKQPSYTKEALQIVAIGIVIVGIAGLSLLLPSIGANIGAGLLFLLGQIVALVGLTMLVLTLKKWMFKIAIILVVGLIVGVQAIAWTNGENEANRIYCEEKSTAGEVPV